MDFRLFKIAADRGSAVSMVNLYLMSASCLMYLAVGFCFQLGVGWQIDLKEAIRYFKASADNGLSDGMYYYGLALITGEEVEDDKKKRNL